MDRLQATLWQAGVEITSWRDGKLVLRSPGNPQRRVSVVEHSGSFVWGFGDHHDTADVAGAVRRIIAQLGTGGGGESATTGGDARAATGRRSAVARQG